MCSVIWIVGIVVCFVLASISLSIIKALTDEKVWSPIDVLQSKSVKEFFWIIFVLSIIWPVVIVAGVGYCFCYGLLYWVPTEITRKIIERNRKKNPGSDNFV